MSGPGSTEGLLVDLLGVCGMNTPKPSRPHWLLDAHVLVALAVAWPVWLGLGAGLGERLWLPASAMAWLSLVLWQPVMEEIAFRGLLQGRLQQTWPARRLGPVSLANGVTTLVFAASHLMHQSPAWALMVIPPSLVMGHLRERFGSAWPAIALHVYYNLGFGLTAWWCHAH